jgi:hypothetical protein
MNETEQLGLLMMPVFARLRDPPADRVGPHIAGPGLGAPSLCSLCACPKPLLKSQHVTARLRDRNAG